MSRDEGFQVGDRSTHTLQDPALIKAYRKAGLGAVVAWDAVLDASWAAGTRVTLEDALLPLPYRLKVADVRAALCEAGLLDAAGCIRETSWRHWFVPAATRRETRRRTGQLGGLRSHGSRSRDEAIAQLEGSSSDADSAAIAQLEVSSSDAIAALEPGFTRPSDRPTVRPSDRPKAQQQPVEPEWFTPTGRVSPVRTAS